jgi:hypothetical protein
MKKLLLLSTLIATNCLAQLTGETRTNFINSTLQACYNVQRSNKVNAKISDELLYNYCKCSAVYSANALTNQIVKDIEGGKREVGGLAQLSNLAGNYCGKQLAK